MLLCNTVAWVYSGAEIITWALWRGSWNVRDSLTQGLAMDTCLSRSKSNWGNSWWVAEKTMIAKLNHHTFAGLRWSYVQEAADARFLHWAEAGLTPTLEVLPTQTYSGRAITIVWLEVGRDVMDPTPQPQPCQLSLIRDQCWFFNQTRPAVLDCTLSLPIDNSGRGNTYTNTRLA